MGSLLDVSTGHRTATAWNSPDGLAWRRSVVESSQEGMTAGVAERNGVVVAVGMVQGRRDRDGAVWSSRDGSTWARVPVGALQGPGDQDLRAVAGGAIGFVASGRDRGRQSSAATMFFSPDGAGWRQVGGDVFGVGFGVTGLAVGPAGAVAVGWSQDSPDVHGAVWFSADGLNWTRATLGQGSPTGVISAVTSSAGGFVAAGQDGEGSARRPVVWRSADGAQWSRTDSPVMSELPGQRSTGGVRVAGLAAGGATFAVGGGRSQQVWRSSDGRDWSRETVPVQMAAGAGTLTSVAAQGGAVVVVATTTGGVELWRRDAGQDWTRVSVPDVFPSSAPTATSAMLTRTSGGLSLLAGHPDDANPGRFGGTTAWTSEDGGSWHSQSDPTGELRHAALGAVTTWSGGLAVAGDVEDETGDRFVRGMVWTSTDGASWRRVPESRPGWNVPGETRIITAVSPLGRGLVAVGVSYSIVGDFDAHVWTSPDALTWSQAPDQPAWLGGGNQVLSGVCSLPGGGVVAVGYTDVDTTQSAWAWTSADGRAWSLASGDGAAALRGAGATWARECVTTPAGVVAAGSEDAPAGRDAALWSSPDGRNWVRRGDAGLLGGQGDQAVAALAANGSRFVAVGHDDDRAAVWYSLDAGATWRRVLDDRYLFGGFTSYAADGVAILGDQIVVSGTGAGEAVVWEGPLPRR